MAVPANAQTIWNYLIGQGLSSNAVAGIEGNIEQESGGSPTAGVWPSNYGLIQWTPANMYFSSPPNMSQQLAGIMKYIKANGSVSDINKHASTPEAAALWFSQHYERPLASAANNPNRESSAGQVAKAAASGKWPASSGVTTTSDIQTTGLLSGIGDIFTKPFEGILSWVGATALQSVGVPDFKDLLQRAGLILLGVILLIVGIHVLASSGGMVSNKAQEIDLVEKYGGNSKGNKGKTTAAKSTATKSTESAARGIGASEAIEAAAVA